MGVAVREVPAVQGTVARKEYFSKARTNFSGISAWGIPLGFNTIKDLHPKLAAAAAKSRYKS